MTNRELFERTYTEELTAAVLAHPDVYTWPIDAVPQVSARMMFAIDRKSYSKDSLAMRATCKKLGIKYTYTAIDAFVRT